jgi:predicted DCC family thiol-disulfide oxidoreductase YuxK
MNETPVDGEGEAGGSDAAIDTDRPPSDIVDDIDRPVLLFDGVCNLCHGTIRAIVKLDAEGEILFAPLQSDVGTELLDRLGMDADYFDSVVLVERDADEWTAYTKSTAVLRTCRYLDGPVPLLYPLVYVPERVRDVAYDLVAKYRYRIFGKKDACTVPDPAIRRRFVERSLA